MLGVGGWVKDWTFIFSCPVWNLFYIICIAVKAVLRLSELCFFGGEGCLHRDLTITIDAAEMMLIWTARNLCVTLDFSAHSVLAVDCSWATDIFWICPFTFPFTSLSDSQNLHCGETIMFCCLWMIGPEVTPWTLWLLIWLCFGPAAVKWTAY